MHAEPEASLDLWDYRRRVAAAYAEVRSSPPSDAAWRRWRQRRDDLFARHPMSALDPERRARFDGLPFFPYDPAWRIVTDVLTAPEERLELGHSGAGATSMHRFGRVRVVAPGGEEVELSLFWLDVYGGGVFLPFRDLTAPEETYGGGRYLLDTVKGADLGHAGRRVVLDFNYAYHPSCVYSDRWSCPLAPPENHLEVAVRAGERLPRR